MLTVLHGPCCIAEGLGQLLITPCPLQLTAPASEPLLHPHNVKTCPFPSLQSSRIPVPDSFHNNYIPESLDSLFKY